MTMNKKPPTDPPAAAATTFEDGLLRSGLTPAVLSKPNMKLGCAACENPLASSRLSKTTDTSRGKASSSTRITPNANSASSM